MYQPILGSAEVSASDHPPPAETPEIVLYRTSKLHEDCEELHSELQTEIGSVDEKIIRPAMDAKEYLQPLKRTIKKRDDKKVRERFAPILEGMAILEGLSLMSF